MNPTPSAEQPPASVQPREIDPTKVPSEAFLDWSTSMSGGASVQESERERIKDVLFSSGWVPEDVAISLANEVLASLRPAASPPPTLEAPLDVEAIRECVGLVAGELGDEGRADRAMVALESLVEKCAHLERHLEVADILTENALEVIASRSPQERREPPCANGDCSDHYGDPLAWCSRCASTPPTREPQEGV
jgi:hypothetical protein